jgi:hypothetical protein
MILNKSEDAHRRFTAYKNYLLSFNYLLNKLYPDYKSLTANLKRIQTKSSIDYKRIHSLLLNSWNSELLLNLPSLFQEDFLKFSNHWSPVQSYYSIYLSLRALIVAKNISAKGDHATTLRVISSNFIQGEKIIPFPWSILLDCSGFQGIKGKSVISPISPLENPFYFRNNLDKLQDSFCLFIKTTRERIIKEKCQEWKDHNPIKNKPRKRLAPGVKNSISKATRPTSIFNCLYRLRIRSNYQDVDIFILGSSAPETKRYFQALCNITDKTLIVLEKLLCDCLGIKEVNNIVDEYLKSDTLGINQKLGCGISNRISFLNNCF